MITEKQKAIEEVKKPEVDFGKIERVFLKDKTVVLAYIQAHSSNDLLLKDFPIYIDSPDLIGDEEFIIEVINHLDVGYSKVTVSNLIKHSASIIMRNELEKFKDKNVEELKDSAARILNRYNNAIKKRAEELARKQSILDEVDKYIKNVELDGGLVVSSNKGAERYRRTDIGFTAKF